MNCSSNTGRFPYAARPQPTPRMVDSASGELKTCLGNSVESFCVRRNTPPFGSSMSSPKMMRRWIFRLLRVTVFPADAFLDLIVNLGEFCGADHTFFNQLIFPAFQRVAFLELL